MTTLLVISFVLPFLFAGLLIFYFSERSKAQMRQHEKELALKRYDATLLTILEKQVGDRFSFKKVIESLVGLLDDSVEHTTASYLILSDGETLVSGLVAEAEVGEKFVLEVQEKATQSLSGILGKDVSSLSRDESVAGNISADGAETVGSYFHIPLTLFGNPIGVLTIASPKVGLYAVSEVMELYVATQKFLMALSRIQGTLGQGDGSHAKMEREYKRRIYQTEVLKELSERIGYSLDLAKIIEIITGSVGQLLEYNVIAYVVESNSKVLFKCDIEEPVNHGFVRDIRGKMLESFSAMLGRTFKEDEIDESVSGAIVSDEIVGVVNSFFNLPLIIAGQPVGLITVASLKPGLYNEEETSVLYTIASQASTAVTRLHEVLEREKGKLNSLVTSLNDGIVMFDPHWNVQVINTEARTLLEIESEQVSLYDVLDKLSGKIDIRTQVEKAISSKVAIPPSVITLGESILQVTILQVNDKEHENLGAVVVFHDITEETAARNLIEQKATELSSANERIEAEKEKAEGILRFLRSIGEGVFATDLAGRVIFMNDAAERFSGSASDQIIGKMFSEVFAFVDKEQHEHLAKTIRRTLEEKKNIELPDKIFFSASDRKIPIAGTCAPIVDETGLVTGSITVFQDVTKKRELEQMKENFLTVVAHQLRTPLGSMRWGIELLESEDVGVLPEEAKTVIGELRQNSERIVEVVDGLLKVSNIGGAEKQEPREVCDLAVLAEEVVATMTEKAQKKSIAINLDLPRRPLPPLFLIRKHATEIIENLISNALRYGREQGSVWVTLTTDKDAIVLSVRDDGIGIPDADKTKIFSKFFRASNAVHAFTDASGLGLALIKSHVEEVGGTISFESEENVGTTFIVRFPFEVEALPQK